MHPDRGRGAFNGVLLCDGAPELAVTSQEFSQWLGAREAQRLAVGLSWTSLPFPRGEAEWEAGVPPQGHIEGWGWGEQEAWVLPRGSSSA